jgi:hypothetical protein
MRQNQYENLNGRSPSAELLIPRGQNSASIAGMEEVLAVYTRPRDPSDLWCVSMNHPNN